MGVFETGIGIAFCEGKCWFTSLYECHTNHRAPEKWTGLLTTDVSLSVLEAHETIGGLFAGVTNDTLELTVMDKIWIIILDIVLEAVNR